MEHHTLRRAQLLGMDDGFQNIVRGQRVEPPPAIHFYPSETYTTAVSLATLGTRLIKEVFDNIIRDSTNDSAPVVFPQRVHMCDPAQYKSAIEDATLNGLVAKEFFEKFVIARATYHVVRFEHPRATRQSTTFQDPCPSPSPQDQVSETHQPPGTQVHHNSQARVSQVTHTPRHRDNENVRQHLHRRQNDRDYRAGRCRSRSPVGFDQTFPSMRAGKQSDQVHNDQEKDAALREPYRDRGRAVHAAASRNHEAHYTAPESVQELARNASPHSPPQSSSEHRHHATFRALHLSRDPSRILDGYTPGTASRVNHPSAYRAPSQHHRSRPQNVSGQAHDRVETLHHRNTAYASTSRPLNSLNLSAIDAPHEKNCSAVRVECWRRNLKCGC